MKIACKTNDNRTEVAEIINVALSLLWASLSIVFFFVCCASLVHVCDFVGLRRWRIGCRLKGREE